LSLLKTLAARVASFLALYGGRGVFAISFLDSSFIALPFVNDLLLIHLASQFPRRATAYVLLCTAGSVLGASTVYGVARAGADLLWRKRSPASMERVRGWLERNEFVTVLVASLLPPPVPFKLFPISAGLLRVSFARFAAGLLVGRGLRFTAEALLGIRYGVRAEAYLKGNILWGSVIIAVMVIGITLVYRGLARREAARRF